MVKDKLQSILECIWIIQKCREKQKPNDWFSLLGEMDYSVELHRLIHS